MESFRKVIKGWLGKALLVLFMTPLALVGIEGYFSGGNSKDSVQSINGQDISAKELEGLTKSFQQQYLQYTNGDETLLNQSFIKNKALDMLVARTLLLQQAEKLGIALSDTQIEQMIAQQPSFQKDGKFSEELFANYLSSQGFPNSQSFIMNIRQDHALKNLTTSVSDFALVSKVDLKQIVDLQTEKRTLHLASIKLDDYKKNIKVTPQEIQDYYNKHSNTFKQIASVNADYILVTPALFGAKEAVISDADLQQAYQKFIETEKAKVEPVIKHILVATDGKTDADAKKLIDTAYAELNKGESFATVAQKFSDDTTSKNTGGQLAAYDKGLFGAEFDKAVASLKVGEISKPLKTQFGYEIIQTQTPSVNVPSLESQKERLTAELKKAKTENAFADAVNGLNEMVVGADSLDVVTQEVKGTKVEAVKNFSLGSHHAVLSDPTVKAKLFNDDVKNGDRNVTSSIQLANGDVVWVKVRDYHAAGVQSLKEATPRVNAKLIEQKAYLAAKAKIQKALNDFKTKPAAVVVSESGIKFENAGTFTRADGLLKRPIERAAFSVMPPKAGMWSTTTAELANEMVVVAVSKVEDPLESALPEQQVQEVSKLYQQLRAQQELDAYTAYLKSKAKIK
ncbi:peptidylprolyl isomerase [Acinetobacter sp. Ac_877]|uniref:SurA N-terminal domain-containing protein n=1 Tax=Acinetobacter portensis TaxID=1839785 RepID=UPI00128CA4FE|nr:SurA N-terminal domain-containing protein [Acinetobacter portensis]MPW40725.1 peptidylprolyl isomerase [Acinetobacter portensis]